MKTKKPDVTKKRKLLGQAKGATTSAKVVIDSTNVLRKWEVERGKVSWRRTGRGRPASGNEPRTREGRGDRANTCDEKSSYLRKETKFERKNGKMALNVKEQTVDTWGKDGVIQVIKKREGILTPKRQDLGLRTYLQLPALQLG